MQVVVIGAGAAGLVASAESASRGTKVILLEKNTKTGVKILMSGGTRCNLTHNTDAKGITEAFGHARRFLQPSVGAFCPADVVQMFNGLGVRTKVESTGKVFPVSNRAIEVRDALHRQAVEAGVDIRLRSGVDSLKQNESGSWTIKSGPNQIDADRVIVTAGGRSWPGCGTTGDAYQWLAEIGHTITRTRPALVPLVGGHQWTQELSGITVPDCTASVFPTAGKQKPLIQRRASWLFTHFGFSGPAAMDVSGKMTVAESLKDVRLQLDLIPQISEAEFRETLSNRSGDGGRKKLTNIVSQWLPSRLAESLVQESGGDQSLAELSKSSANKLIQVTKQLHLPVNGTRGFAKAEVTAGGVSLKEVDPRTMASRKATNLFIAGEVLDVDGWIGGYNFQAAFSTGRAAGIAASLP